MLQRDGSDMPDKVERAVSKGLPIIPWRLEHGKWALLPRELPLQARKRGPRQQWQRANGCEPSTAGGG